MSDRPTQETLVTTQFGPQAAAYVQSAVHAQGKDLQQLAAMVGGLDNARALDLGCGGGHVAFYIAPHVREVVAYDLSSDMLAAVSAEARKRRLGNVATHQGAVESLPFADQAFDVVMTRFSAHHWRNVPAALREARRVIKPNGIAAFVDCVAPPDPLFDTYLQGIELLRDPSHVRDYSVAEWTAMLRGAGFRPGAVTMRRLPLDYAAWIARQSTPGVQADAIRALQKKMSGEVVRHFEIADDGSFTIDVATIEAVPV
jgi:SAM-dependent methyltransferase